MGKAVQVKVSGTSVSSNGEEITTLTRGNMIYKEPYYYVSYEEKIDDESSDVAKTVLRYSPNELRVTRKGQVESVLEFGPGKEHNSIYMTSFGNFDIQMITDAFDMQIAEDVTKMAVAYRIGLNGMLPTKGNIKIEIIG